MYEIGGNILVIFGLANGFSRVFSDVGAVVLVEMGNELMRVDSERRGWRFFDMILEVALCSRGGGAGRDGTAKAPAP